ncbi:MAG TPA: LLM class flavin-dependent oxidoreductase [Solirubrobacteraceae bacterium]|jgi:alkanesulfonate monooxygenase SsuD/methylene tetrahydromethanopterin reductase-like flavin-dependent oxidoreductase (luciferase family)
MRFLLAPTDADSLDRLLSAGRVASAEGLDGVLLRASVELPAPLVTAAVLARAVPHILVAVEIPIGDRHPLEVAEEAAVVDLVAGGRLVLVVRAASGTEDDFDETLDFLRTAFGARPFRWSGRRWRSPANLAENVNNPEHRTRLMPPPAQPRLEVWTGGAHGLAATSRGIGHLADVGSDPEELAKLWRTAEDNPAAVGAPRGLSAQWEGGPELVARLRAGRAAFGQDWAVVSAPASAAAELGRYVRPRVVLDELPPGLEDHWDSVTLNRTVLS